MDHAKKFMLVEPKMYKASMREKTLSKLDEDIENTLNSDLDDSEKALKYIDSLRRYKYYGETDSEKKVEKPSLESEILSTVSIGQRHKAKRLLDHLKRDANFKIGEEGEIVYKQQKLHRSHVGDLLNDVLSKTNSEDGPLGWEEFASSLKSLAVPKDLVENPRRWKHIRTESPPPPPPRKVRATPMTTRAIAKRRLRKQKWLNYDGRDGE